MFYTFKAELRNMDLAYICTFRHMDELITGPYEDMESIKKKLLKACTGDHFNPLAKASRISRCTTGGHKQWQSYNITRKNP